MLDITPRSMESRFSIFSFGALDDDAHSPADLSLFCWTDMRMLSNLKRRAEIRRVICDSRLNLRTSYIHVHALNFDN